MLEKHLITHIISMHLTTCTKCLYLIHRQISGVALYISTVEYISYLYVKQTMCQILWDWLDTPTPMYHRRSVELLYQLHQVTPSGWMCEDVIGQALVQEPQVQFINFILSSQVIFSPYTPLNTLAELVI